MAVSKITERTETNVPVTTDTAVDPGTKSNLETPVRTQKTADEIAKLPLDPGEYMKLFKPRISGIPHTAPIYDELTQPVEAPKTYCVSWRKGEIDHCQCYTQQITQIKMSYSACKNIVNYRMWDPTLRSATYSSEGNLIDG